MSAEGARLQPPEGRGVDRLVEVMRTLRTQCPWDAEQTHRSLVNHLIEETAEVVDAIESANDVDLREELGDLLLQVVFHCQISAEEGGFDLQDVADDVATKLVRRHPYVYGDAEVPDEPLVAWEARKQKEKHRRSALEGIATSLPTLARAHKVVARSRQHGLDVDALLAATPVAEDDPSDAGRRVLQLVARLQAAGEDADQVTREALRLLEAAVVEAEQNKPANREATPANDPSRNTDQP